MRISHFAVRFRNSAGTGTSSELLVAGFNGDALVAKTYKGSQPAGTFDYKAMANVKLAGPDGTGVHSVSHGGLYSGKFEAAANGNSKPMVTLGNHDGTAVAASTVASETAKAAWGGLFTANEKTQVQLAHTGGQGLRVSTTAKKLWSTEINHDGVKVELGNHDGQGVKSFTSNLDAQVWNAYFGNAEHSAVRLSHSSGSGIASWSFKGDKWNAIFGHGKPANAMVKMCHKSGTAIQSVTNKGSAYNAVFSNQNSNLVQLAGPKGQGIYSETKIGEDFNTHIINKGTAATVEVKVAGGKGEGIVSTVKKGIGPAGRFEVGERDIEKQSYVEFGLSGGKNIHSYTGNGATEKWNTIIQYGTGVLRSSEVRLGGSTRNGAMYAETQCQAKAADIWNSVFHNTGFGKPTVKTSHSSGQALWAHTEDSAQTFNAKFASGKTQTGAQTSAVEFAHGDGRSIVSHTDGKPNVYNARFSNSKASEVSLAHGGGVAIKSVTKEQGAWNALFENRDKAVVKLAHWDGVALYANNNHKSGSYAAKVESLSAQGPAAASVQLAHPSGMGLWSHTTVNDPKSASAKFTHTKKVEVLVATVDGRAIDTTVNSLLSGDLLRLQAGEIKGETRKYRSVLNLGNPSGSALVSTMNDAPEDTFNSIIEQKKGSDSSKTVSVKIAQGSGQGIRSETLNKKGKTPSGYFSHSGPGNTKVSLASHGEAIISKSEGSDKFNAKFSHGEVTEVKLAGHDGHAIRSTISSGTAWNAIFEDKSKGGKQTTVNMCHTNGVAIKTTSTGTTKFNAEFEHQSKCRVRMSHGSGLAIDSETTFMPSNDMPLPPAPGTPPPPPPPPILPKPPKKEGNATEGLESLLQLAEGNEESKGDPSNPSGAYNARFTHIGRASVHIANGEGTALEARSFNGKGSCALFEKGKGPSFQRITLGHETGLALQAETMIATSFAGRFKQPKADVFIAGPKELIYAHTKKSVTPENKKDSVLTIRNDAQTLLRIRNDGHVVIGQKKGGYLYVSGNAYVEGSLHTTINGKKIDFNKELAKQGTEMSKLREENESMRLMMKEMKEQNEAMAQRMEMLERSLAAR